MKTKNYAKKLAEYLASDEEYSVLKHDQNTFGESKELKPNELEVVLEPYFKGYEKMMRNNKKFNRRFFNLAAEELIKQVDIIVPPSESVQRETSEIIAEILETAFKKL